MTQWTVFTRRTDDPKLTWLELQLTEAGIPHRRNGESWHAPILEVPADQLDAAWAILDPVDDIPDDDPMFDGTSDDTCATCGAWLTGGEYGEPRRCPFWPHREPCIDCGGLNTSTGTCEDCERRESQEWACPNDTGGDCLCANPTDGCCALSNAPCPVDEPGVGHLLIPVAAIMTSDDALARFPMLRKAASNG